MMLTRRKVFLGSITLPLLSGCTQVNDSSFNIVELEVILVNGQDEPLTFRFALETTEDVGEWSSYEVESEGRRVVTVEPPEKPLVAIHASVAGYDVSGELLKEDSGEVCLRIFIEFALADKPTILQSTDVSC